MVPASLFSLSVAYVPQFQASFNAQGEEVTVWSVCPAVYAFCYSGWQRVQALSMPRVPLLGVASEVELIVFPSSLNTADGGSSVLLDGPKAGPWYRSVRTFQRRTCCPCPVGSIRNCPSGVYSIVRFASS